MENQVQVQENVKVEVTLESLGFAAGTKYQIKNRIQGGKEILKDRLVILTKPSKKAGLVLGHLLHEKTGEPQRTEISLPVSCVFEYTAPVAEVIAEVATETQEASVEQSEVKEQEAV